MAYGRSVLLGMDVDMSDNSISNVSENFHVDAAVPWHQITNYVAETASVPATHASTHMIGGADLLNLTNITGYVANAFINHTAVTLSAGNGLTGGGDISANRTFTVGPGDGIGVSADTVSARVDQVTITLSAGTIAALTGAVANGVAALATGDEIYDWGTAAFVPVARTVTAGAGMTGGGALSGDITLNVIAGDGINVVADSISVNSTNLVIANYGLSVVDNNIRILLPASSGLTLGASGLVVDGDDGISVGAGGVAVDSTVVRTTGNQSIAGNKTFSGITYMEDLIVNDVTVTNSSRLLSHLTVSGVQTNANYIVMSGATSAARTITTTGADGPMGRDLTLAAVNMTGGNQTGGFVNVSAGDNNATGGRGGHIVLEAGDAGGTAGLGGETKVILANGILTKGKFVVYDTDGTTALFTVDPN